MIEANLAVGLALRSSHFASILETRPDISWFEAISENHFDGPGFTTLEKIREHYPVVLHGVSMSIGSTDPLDFVYLKNLKRLAERIGPRWMSDHICWTGVNGENLHDLLPLPYTEEALNHLTERIGRVQDFLGRRLAFENVSAYLSYRHSEMSEWDFLAELSRRADCDLLLDINNVYVSSVNQHFDPLEFLAAIPVDRVRQFHLAGHSTGPDGVLIDTHDAPIAEPVWGLFAAAVQRFGRVPTLIERDDKIPELPAMRAEMKRAQILWEAPDVRRDDGPTLAP